MTRSENQFIDIVLKNAQKLDHVDQDEIHKVARQLEKNSKYRIKDYEVALTHFTSIYNFIKEEKSTDTAKERDMYLSKLIIEKTIEIRRHRDREVTKMDTNLLTHGPYFVGGNRKRKRDAKDDGYVMIVKGGLREIAYENEKGEFNSMADAQTLVALFTLWEEQGFGEWIRFTEYQLLDRLKAGDGGNQYRKVRDSLQKLWNTTIVMQEAYDVETGRREVTKRLRLISEDETKTEYGKKGELRSKTYGIKFSDFVMDSVRGGHYSLVSLAVLTNLEVDTAQGIYLLISGIRDMDRNDEYLREDGLIEIPLDELYESLFLESAKHRNRAIVERGCEELKNEGVIDDFYFAGPGKRPNKLVIAPSDWQLSLIRNNKDRIELRNHQGELELDIT